MYPSKFDKSSILLIINYLKDRDPSKLKDAAYAGWHIQGVVQRKYIGDPEGSNDALLFGKNIPGVTSPDEMSDEDIKDCCTPLVEYVMETRPLLLSNCKKEDGSFSLDKEFFSQLIMVILPLVLEELFKNIQK